MLILKAVPSLAMAFAAAANTLVPRLAASCANFPQAGTFDTHKNFTLTAVPTAGGAAVPLYVNYVYSVIYTGWDILSAGGNSLTINMASGYLQPFHPEVPVEPQQTSSGLFVPDGTSPSFQQSQYILYPSPSYCGVPNPVAGAAPLLALNGHTDQFYLCNNHTNTANGRVDLVYNAPASTCGTCLTGCYSVNVEILFN